MACLLALLLALAAIAATAGAASAPNICVSGSVPPLLQALYAPGLVTVDGNSDDWKSIPGMRVRLRQVVGGGSSYLYGDGEATIKAVHDGRDLFVLMQVTGPYVFSSLQVGLNPAMALMFSIGANATFLDMGGCLQEAGSCTAATCSGHEVDIMQFQPRLDAVPGRLYGTNIRDIAIFSGDDRYGHLTDMYAFNPHCKWADGPIATPDFNIGSHGWGAGGAQNDWLGAWQHTSMGIVGQSPFAWGDQVFGVNGSLGDYVYEFSRPLVTQDRLQQDVQLAIGRVQRFGAAFWYPISGQPWNGYEHFLAHCDWMDLELLPGTGAGAAAVGATGATVLGSVSVVMSLGAVVAAAYAGCLLRRHHGFEGLARLT
ncbi:heme binding protein [Klebsormidium nitens]|uniref:Heme binding protein n=1 Tax=Klebsormidium nitens TaxID=105231 RepID=A0A1Y1HZ16_KLENI|nr:heme binding protein [Klebsormidium nitens]|eukprot:GAQ82982.1 heme binding protein [Klebsormidium nitens]